MPTTGSYKTPSYFDVNTTEDTTMTMSSDNGATTGNVTNFMTEFVNVTSVLTTNASTAVNVNSSAEAAVDGYSYLGHVLTREVLNVSRTIPFFISFFGFIGNALVIIILFKKRNRDSPMAVFLGSLAVSDIVVLLCSPLSFWIDTTFFTSVRYAFGCHVHLFLTYTSVQISSWIVVALTIERVICVTFPLKAKILCVRQVSVAAVILIVTLISALNLHLLVGFSPHAGIDGGQPFCAFITEAYLHFIYTYFIFIDLFVTNIVPVVLMSIGNIIIIRKMAQRYTLRKQMTSQPSNKANNSLTLTLLLVNSAFIVTMTPYCIDIVGSAYLGLWQLDIMGITFMNLLSNLNAAQNFVLYFLQGTAFRKEVKRLFGCAKGAQQSTVGAFSAETAKTTASGE